MEDTGKPDSFQNYFWPVSNHICPPEGKTRQLFSTAHAADDALTVLRIYRRTLYNARAACKMVCEISVSK
jgi:hypothetical protein